MTFLEMECIPQHIVKMCKPQPVRVPPHKVSTKCGQGAEIGYNKNMGNKFIPETLNYPLGKQVSIESKNRICFSHLSTLISLLTCVKLNLK